MSCECHHAAAYHHADTDDDDWSVWIDGKDRHIGCYQDEEEAAADYARAVFKCRGPEALKRARERNLHGLVIDLSDVP